MNEKRPTETTPTTTEHASAKPGLIKVLGPYLIALGAIGLYSSLFVPDVASGAPGLPFSLGYSANTLLAFGVLGIVTGIGLWLGKAWGWWLGVLYFLYTTIQNTIFLLASSGAIAASVPSSWSHQPGYYTMMFLLTLIVQLALLAYFFKSNVRAYFGVENRPMWRQILLLIVVAGVISLILWFV